jgi:tetratricopeptide (TPR) repeat protein
MAPQVPEELKAGALQGAGVLACRMGEFERAIQLTEASAVLWEDLGVFEGRLRSLNILGIAASGQKDYARARQFQEDQAELAREAGAEKALATALHNLGAVAESSGDFATALRRYEESLVIDRERSDQSGIAQSLLAIGSVLVRDGRGREAREFLTQALELMLALEYMEGVAEALVAFAALAELEQAHETSATLLGAADALRQQVWAQPIDSGIGAWTMDTTRRSLGVEAFETLRRSGARMEPEAAAALALASND